MKYAPPRYLFRRHELLRVVRTGQNFLEIGPGSMELAQELLAHFQKGTLIELNQKACDIYDNLPASTKRRLKLLIADFLKMPLSDKFDCVIACEVLEHVEEEEEFVKRITDSLQPGGQLILSVPARMNLWSKDDELVGHIRRYDKISITQLLHNHGYFNIRIIAYGYPFTIILRWLRIVFAKRQLVFLKLKSKKERTARSGIEVKAGFPHWLGVFCNTITIYPFASISSFFNNHDLSDSYLVVAEKS
jgi:SAM-dependent methyltransferase